MSADEVAAILDGIPTETALALRDRMKLEALFSSGLRRSELMRLQLLDIDEQILRFEERLAVREERMVLQFSRLENAISALQSQASFLGTLR